MRGSDIVPEHFEQLGQGPCRVTVVIDNKNTRRVIGCPGANVTVLARGWLGNFGGGEADSELRSRVRAAALCRDGCAVKFGEPLGTISRHIICSGQLFAQFFRSHPEELPEAQRGQLQAQEAVRRLILSVPGPELV